MIRRPTDYESVALTVYGRDSPANIKEIQLKSSDFDFNLYAGRKLELHQGVDGLCVGIVDVQEAAIGVELKLLAGLLVDEGRTVHREDLLVGRQRNRAANLGTCRGDGVGNLLGALVEQHVVE